LRLFAIPIMTQPALLCSACCVLAGWPRNNDFHAARISASLPGLSLNKTVAEVSKNRHAVFKKMT